MPAKPYALSVKVMVQDGRGRCLLIKRSLRSKGNPGKWDLPGGKIDPGETFDVALAREVFEETRLRIVIDGVAGATESESPARKVVHLIMKGRRKSGRVRLSEEHDAYMWVDAREAARMQADICESFRSLVCGEPETDSHA